MKLIVILSSHPPLKLQRWSSIHSTRSWRRWLRRPLSFEALAE